MNRIKRFSLALFGLVLLLGLVFTGCDTPSVPGVGPGDTTVTVTFDLGYDGAPEPVTVDVNVTSANGTRIPANRWPRDPSRTGHRFLEWRLVNSEGTVTNTVVTQTYRFREDTTLRAQWEAFTMAAPNDPTEAANLFSTSNGFPAQLSDARKIWGTINPTITFAFLADPKPLWYCHASPPCIESSAPGTPDDTGCDECRLYLVGSNDTIAFNAQGAQIPEPFGTVIQGLRIISSNDLVNWTEHGIHNFVNKASTHPLFPGPYPRVADYSEQQVNDTWAPSFEWKMVDGSPVIALYWCNSGTNTGVVISDGPNASPIGPWRDPGFTRPLIHRGLPNSNVEWLFDPGSIMDEDGTVYMIVGSGGSGRNSNAARRIKLGSNMYSLDGNLETIDVPYVFEAMDFWKWNGIYYLNYTVNWGAAGNPYGFSNIDVAYMKNREGPMAPFPTDLPAGSSWGGPRRILPNEANGDTTNHSSLFDFRGKPYIVYHSNMQCRAGGITRMRTAHLLEVNIDEEGHIQQMQMGRNSKPGNYTREDRNAFQVTTYNPYIMQEAETVAITGGVYTRARNNSGNDSYLAGTSNGHTLASINTGDWVGIYGVDFNRKSGGATRFNAIVILPETAEGETYTGAIEIRLNPSIQGAGAGITNLHQTTVGTGNNQQTRITGGEVVGRLLVRAASKADENKRIVATVEFDQPITGLHDVAFVFYSSRDNGIDNRERHNTAINRNNDGRAINTGFEIDQWWFE